MPRPPRREVAPDIAAAPELRSLDAKLEKAGLVRARRIRTPSETPRSIDSTVNAELSARHRLSTPPRIAPNGVQWLAAPGWERFEWLWHGFSTRIGGRSRVYSGEREHGELNLGFTADDARENVIANRRLLAEAVTGSPETPLVGIRQIHSSVVVVVRAESGGKAEKADGLMTAEPGLLLAVQTADCIPVLVADRKRRAVAAFHAGWRGTVKRIVEAGVGRMRLEFGSRQEDLIAAIGPGIGQCCYAVGEEVLAEFESQFGYASGLFLKVDDADPVLAKYPMMFMNQRAPGHGPRASRIHLDLVEANRRQLLAAGVKPSAIQIASGCTSCYPGLFFSHRASGGRTGRMMSVIGIRP